MTVSASRSATSSQPIFSGIPDMCHSGRRKLPLLTGAAVPAFSHHPPDETLERPSWFAPGIALHSRPARGTPRRERRGDPVAGKGDRAFSAVGGAPLPPCGACHRAGHFGPDPLAWFPSPALRGGKKVRSRGAFFRVRALADDKLPSDETNRSERRKLFRPRTASYRLASGTHDPEKWTSGFRKRSCARKGSGTPADARLCCPHASGVRDAPRRKAACAALRLRARSPAGVPLRFSPAGLSSQRLSVGPGFPKTAQKLRRRARTTSVTAKHLARRS